MFQLQGKCLCAASAFSLTSASTCGKCATRGLLLGLPAVSTPSACVSS